MAKEPPASIGFRHRFAPSDAEVVLSDIRGQQNSARSYRRDRRSSAYRLLMIFASLLILPVVVTSPSMAFAPYQVPVVLRNFAGKCLDVARGDSSDGTEILSWDCHGSYNQQWVLRANKVYSLGKCLDVKGGDASNGTPIVLFQCHFGANQDWSFNSNGTIVGLAGKCLDVEGANPANGAWIILFDCHGGPNQRWSFGAVDPNSGSAIARGYVTGNYYERELVITLDNGCLDAEGGVRRMAQGLSFGPATVAPIRGGAFSKLA